MIDIHNRKFNHLLLIFLLIFSIFLNPVQSFGGGEVSLSKGLDYFQQRKYPEARDEFNRILRTAPSNAMAHYYLGLTMSKLNRHQQAVTSFKKALDLDPALTDVYLSLGISYYKLRSYDQALVALQKALQADTGNVSASFFTGLVYQEKGQHAKAIPYFKKAMSGDREFNQMALYNMGVSYDKMGDPASARRSFSRAIELDPESDMAKDAKNFLEIMAAKPGKKKRWNVEASAGWEYDDNVTRIEEDVVSGESDIAGVFEFEGEFKILDTPEYELEAGYDFFQSVYEDITTFNFQSHGFNLSGSRSVGNWDIGTDYSYTFSTLDADDFLGLHSLTPSAGLSHHDNMYTNFSYIYQDKNFFTGDRRDAANHSFGIDHFIFFMAAKGYVLASYKLETENAFGGEFDYLGYQAKVVLKAPIPFDSIVKISYKYNFRDYENITPSIAQEREDEKHTIKLELSKKIIKHVRAKFKYEYIDSISNLPSVDFTENVVTLAFEFFI